MTVPDRRVTYSPKVFIPITKLCRDKCHYCTFVETPGQLKRAGHGMFLSPDEILEIARDERAALPADVETLMRGLRLPHARAIAADVLATALAWTLADPGCIYCGDIGPTFEPITPVEAMWPLITSVSK